MTARGFKDRLSRRAKRAHVPFTDEVCEALRSYYLLLARWNTKINLTALPLDPPTDETFDRLLIEPLVAARHVVAGATRWFDLGSGGGSPAIPLKIARPELQLSMVESKVRKAAFLREAIRVLSLSDSTVENARFEELCTRPGLGGTADLVSVRAVRVNEALATAARALLRKDGLLFLFRSDAIPFSIKQFELAETVPLSSDPRSQLTVFRRVFHVEQKALTPPS